MTDMGRPILAVVLAFFGLGLCGPITAVPAMVIARKGLAEGASGVGAGTKMQLFQIAWWLVVVDLLVWVLVLLFLGSQYIPAWKRF
jgi:hypothetical protein